MATSNGVASDGVSESLSQNKFEAAEFYDELWGSLTISTEPTSRSHKKASFYRDWSGYIKRGQFIGEGGFGEVHMGEWTNLPIQYYGRAAPRVVVKTVRSSIFPNKEDSRALKLLDREVLVCASLRHPNIVPFIGVTFGLSENIQAPSLISLFMRNGSLQSYCQKNPDTLRTPMLLDVAKGITYLHNNDPEVVHGDIKAENILVDDRGQLRLTDFGLSRMLSDESYWVTTASSVGGSLRWMAPELVDPHSQVKMVTKASDIYAFAMTALEIITGKIPFPDHNDGAVMVTVCMQNQRPDRPREMKNWTWKVLNKCWLKEASERPSMSEVVSYLEDILG